VAGDDFRNSLYTEEDDFGNSLYKRGKIGNCGIALIRASQPEG
jgi:hypothetical protein